MVINLYFLHNIQGDPSKTKQRPGQALNDFVTVRHVKLNVKIKCHFSYVFSDAAQIIVNLILTISNSKTSF